MKRITKWYMVSTIVLSASTSLYMPVFYVYLSNLNYNNTEIGLFYSLFWLASTLAEVPFGLFTDRHGTGYTLVFGSVLKVFGFLCLLNRTESMVLLLAAAVVTGVGEAGYSGCLGAWFVKEYNYFEEKSNGIAIKNYFARAGSVSSITGLAVGLFSGQILYNINFAYPIYASIGLFVGMSILFLLFPKDHCLPERKGRHRISSRAEEKGLSMSWVSSHGKILVIFLILSFLDVVNCGPGNQWSKVFEDLRWNGYIWVAISLVSLLSNLLVDRCAFLDYNKKAARRLFLLETFLLGGVYLLRWNLYISIVFFLVYVLFYGIHKTLVSTYLQEHIICDDNRRTTFTSVYNMLNALIVTVVLFAVGCLSDYIGMTATWFAVAAVITLIYLIIQTKTQGVMKRCSI